MKRLLLTLLTLSCLALSWAQNVHEDYLDGALYVKLSDLSKIENEDPDKISFRSERVSAEGKKSWSVVDLPFYEILEGYELNSVTRPFEVANDDGLKNTYRIEIDQPQRVDELIDKLSRQTSVEYAEKVPYLVKTVNPNDPSYNSSSQWNLFQVNASQAWNYSLGDPEVTVAIVDDAVDYNHPDLLPTRWANPGEIPGNGIDDDGNGYIDDVVGWDVADQNNDPSPPNNSFDHGTHVAGIAAAATDNSTGVASIGHNLTHISVKATNSATAVTHGYEGVMYAVAAGADVINMSWGGAGSSQTAQNIITNAANQGIVLVAAAGNDNVSSVFYPAGYSEVIAVASTTFGDSKSGFSNYGSWIDISAPGSAIYSTVPGGGYQTKQGTSMASPMVAGLAGLMLSLNPSLSPQDIENCILTTADDIDGANPSHAGELGAGRINAEAAMDCISATLNWAPEADFTADLVQILEGQEVNFTDQSIYNPDTWEWTFQGGTPNTFTGQNPPAIEYANAGVYEVSLEVSNANGSDTETKTGYITVNELTGCDTLSNMFPGDLFYTINYGPAGYFGGHNELFTSPVGSVDQWAEKFEGVGPTNVMGANFAFTNAETTNSNAFITVKVWEEDATGGPGTIVYTEDVLITDIEDNVAGSFFTNVAFDQAVEVTTTDFFVGFEVYNGVPGDTVACAGMNENVPEWTPPRDNTVWIFSTVLPGNGWDQFDEYAAASSLHIYPRIAENPPQAVIQPSPSSACVGEFVTFDGSNSPNTVNWQWAINGTTNNFPTGSSPEVAMNAAGNHWAYMLAENSCGFTHLDSVQVTVDPVPNMNITSTGDTICPGDNAMLTVTGADSYVWSPAGSLTCTNCDNPTADPTNNTTYTVVGTVGGCEAEAYYTIIVDNSIPDADFLSESDTLCAGRPTSFNGAITDGAFYYDWDIQGGTPNTSSSSVAEVVFNTPGTYDVTLVAENFCGLDDDITKQFVVVELDECPLILSVSEDDIKTNIFFDNIDEMLNVDLSDLSGKGNLYITAVTGQIVHNSEAKFCEYEQINLSHLSPGMYTVVVEEANRRTFKRFVK